MRYCRLICLILCVVLFAACSETPMADPSTTVSPTESMSSTAEASLVDDDRHMRMHIFLGVFLRYSL